MKGGQIRVEISRGPWDSRDPQCAPRPPKQRKLRYKLLNFVDLEERTTSPLALEALRSSMELSLSELSLAALRSSGTVRMRPCFRLTAAMLLYVSF